MRRPAQKDEGRDVLRKKLGRLEYRKFHGYTRLLHPLVQRATDQGLMKGHESAGTQECIQSSKSRQFALSISYASLGACPRP